jgi:hypothetical protein
MANSTGIEQKLLLVLDCSPVGSGHLKAAVNFAACLGLPIEALLVEDVNLTRLVRSASELPPSLRASSTATPSVEAGSVVSRSSANLRFMPQKSSGKAGGACRVRLELSAHSELVRGVRG